jgi:serine/threonine protein kinase
MNETPAQPAAPPADKVTDTLPHGLEATGNPPADATLPQPAGMPASASGTELMPSVAGYTVLAKIGEGGMGAVYLAEDSRLGRKAAVKTMRPELAANKPDRDRFVREARAAAAVESDYIVPIWQVGDAADGTPFIAMPFLQGEMLDSRLKREPVASLGLILKVAREVAEGLAAAHAKGLIHRDIKPANVWLEGDPAARQLNEQIRRCKVLDFGLARSVDKDDAQITASGAILGTPAYMAPEQARGERVDHRADLFSLGVTLYRMATGKLPFSGPSAMAVLIALTTETPKPVRELSPGLPPAVAELIERLMSKDPAGRPQSAAEVVAAVRRIVKDLQAKKAGPAASASPAPSSSQPVPVYVLPTSAASPGEDVTEAEDEAPVAKKARPAKRNRAPWLIAGGVLGLLALCATLAAVVIRVQTAEGTLVVEISDPAVEAKVKNGKLVLVDADGKDRYTISPAAERDRRIDAGEYTIRVEGADGLALDTREFTLKKNGQVTVRVTLDPKPLAKKAEPPKRDDPKMDSPNLEADLKAAEYVLSVGGSVQIDGATREIKAVKDLPAKPFTLTAVSFNHADPVTEAGLAVFDDCRNLVSLTMYSPRIGDASLAHFKNCADLTDLSLVGTRVGNEGLAHVRNFKKLRMLFLVGTRVTDAGLAQLKSCGLLAIMSLESTEVGDGGLEHLKAIPTLTQLSLRRTRVTAAGVAEFAKAVPECLTVWDDGLIKPKGRDPELNRYAAQFMLDYSGTVRVNGQKTDIRRAADLPEGDFRLTWVDLRGKKQLYGGNLFSLAYLEHLTDVYLDETQFEDRHLHDIKWNMGLVTLSLAGTRVTDAALDQLKRFQKLTLLNVKETKMTAKGVADLSKALPMCKILWDGGLIEPASEADRKAAEWVLDAQGVVHIDGAADDIKAKGGLPKGPFRLTAVYLTKPSKDADLAAFDGCRNVTDLYLVGTGITGAGLAHFAGCAGLKELYLSGTKVDDAAVPIIKQFAKLTDLSVGQTKISEKAVKELAKALPACRIQHDGGTIEPAKK